MKKRKIAPLLIPFFTDLLKANKIPFRIDKEKQNCSTYLSGKEYHFFVELARCKKEETTVPVLTENMYWNGGYAENAPVLSVLSRDEESFLTNLCR